MPSGYVCSHCGAPVSPAQNRCHQCGAEIDWEKAVGRVSYIRYLPAARRRRRRRRLLLAGVLLILMLSLGAWWGWRADGTQNRWRSGRQGLQHLRSGQLDAARRDFGRMVAVGEKQTPASSPTPAPSPTPAVPLAVQPPASPTATFTPAASSVPAPTSRPEPEPSRAQALIQLARKTGQQNPCGAADLLQQALDFEDAPAIEDLRQSMEARCQQLTVTPPIQLNSPLPAPPGQRIAYTAYDIPSGLYSIRTWNLNDRLFGSKLADWAMQPAFGPGGSLIFRSVRSDAPGIYLRSPGGDLRRITQGPDDRWPRWGPGGGQILFTSARRSPDESPHIYLVDIDTGVVEDLGSGQRADWSRTGQIIFSGCDAGGRNCGLWQMDPTSLQRTQLTAIPDDNAPAWSPDGRYAAFMSSGRGQGWDVFILNVQTGFIIPTASHPAQDGLPAWSPDGRSIAFLSNRDGDWGVYIWRLDDLTTSRLFFIGAELPNWQQAGLDWGS